MRRCSAAALLLLCCCTVLMNQLLRRQRLHVSVLQVHCRRAVPRALRQQLVFVTKAFDQKQATVGPLQSHGSCRCTVDEQCQGYTSSSSSRSSTVFRADSSPAAPAAAPRPTLRPCASFREAPLALSDAVPQSTVLAQMVACAGTKATAYAHVHLAVARLYAEVVLLPDLQPQERPEEALQVCSFDLAVCTLAPLKFGKL